MPVLKSPPAAAELEPVALIVPARNEAENIATCLKLLFAQHYADGLMQVVVIDDSSTDGTRALAEAAAAGHRQVRVEAAGQLPPGAAGKPHACATGAATIGPKIEWLCFIDADVQLAPKAIAAAVVHARTNQLDMLCVAPRQLLGSFAARLVVPCGFYALAFSGQVEQSRRPGHVAATGQFMLVRHAAYTAVGGHNAVIGSIVEDFALAQTCSAAGYRVKLVDGGHLASVHTYADWSSLWDGFAKNLVELFGGPANTVAVAAAALILSWMSILVPLVVVLDGPRFSATWDVATGLAALTTLALLGFHAAGAVFLRIPVWYALLFPAGYTVGALIAFDSVWRHLRGGARWKGRTYT